MITYCSMKLIVYRTIAGCEKCEIITTLIYTANNIVHVHLLFAILSRSLIHCNIIF